MTGTLVDTAFPHRALAHPLRATTKRPNINCGAQCDVSTNGPITLTTTIRPLSDAAYLINNG